MNAETPGIVALASAAALLVVNVVLSLALSLGLSRLLLVAATRMAVQLLLVGFVLQALFGLRSPWAVAGLVLVMCAAASREIAARQELRFAGAWGYGLGAGTAVLATACTSAVGLVALRHSPWYAPQVVVPLVGIVLGSVMNGTSIALNAFCNALVRERAAIEARLALGADRHLATRALQRGALRAGTIPIVNQMSAAGIITLPGLMTGQVLAGMAPGNAARYQIFVLLLLAGGSALGAIVVTMLAAWRATDGRDRLRLDRFDGP